MSVAGSLLGDGSDVERGQQQHVCRVYATIREPLSSLAPTTVCSQRQRFNQVLLSSSNTVELRILRAPAGAHKQPPAFFLLHFEGQTT